MKPAFKPALEHLSVALERLENAVDSRLNQEKAPKEAPQLDLSRNEREVNKKIAAKLDQTISRLETLLNEE